MAQTSSQRRAADAVAAWLAHNERSQTWLCERTGLDPATVRSFLSGERWPKIGNQGKIEKALGWPSGAIRQIGMGEDPESVGAIVQTPGYVASPGTRVEGGVSNEELFSLMLRMRADSDQIHAKIDALSERVERLEKPGS